MRTRTVTETIPEVMAGERADRVVALLTGLSRGEVAAMVEAGAVLVDGRPLPTRSRRMVAGEVLEVRVPDARPEGLTPDPRVDVPVVFADDDVIVVDKPAGLVVHPYTFRVENTFLPADFDSSASPNDSGNLFGEIAAYRKAGIDGLFTDNTDIAVAEEKEAR